ncbi:MAG: transposase zinc-binding domain-containing protein [Synechococcaceae cyanobacterium]
MAGNLKILLFLWITRYRAKLKQTHGDGLHTSHRQALQAMARCRQQGSDLMVLACQSCQQTNQVPHSYRHRSCPHGQHCEASIG